MLKKLKRVVIKEEFLELTGDFVEAIILNQFFYWNERMEYLDKIIEEEISRAKSNNIDVNMPLTEGWIYKKAEQLQEEIMISTPSNINKKINDLVEKGYLEKRNNPNYAWDRTLQYRLNISKIVVDLGKLGYTLEGYKIPNEAIEALISYISPQENCISTEEKCNYNDEKCISPEDKSISPQYRAIPEITNTEITITENISSIDQSINQSIYLTEDENLMDRLKNDIDDQKENAASSNPRDETILNKKVKLSFVKQLKEKYKLTDYEMQLCLSRIKNRTDIKNINSFLEVVVKNYCENEKDTYNAARNSSEDISPQHIEVCKIGDRNYNIKELENQLLGRV